MGQMFRYESGGEEVGPVSGEELKAAARDGRLRRDGRIRKEGSETWTTASQVKGLFPDAHQRVREVANQVGKTAKTVSKAAKATGKVADAVTDAAEAGDKVGRAFTAVVGLSAGGSTLLGGVGDFLRPLGNVNLIVFATALLSAGVLYFVARRKGFKVRMKLKLGSVVSLVVALVFGLWSGLGAFAGKDNKGVLATNVPAVERAQAVLPVARPPVAERPADPEPKEDPVGEITRFEGIPNTFSTVAFTSEGDRLVYVACKNLPDPRTYIAVWDLATRRRVRKVDLPGVRNFNAALSPAGHRSLFMATGVRPDGTIPLGLWDPMAEREVRRLRSDSQPMDIAISADGGRAVSSNSGGGVVVWDLEKGEVARRLGVLGKLANAGSISPSGKLAAAREQGGDRSLHVWDAGTGELVRRIQGPVQAYGPAAFSPDDSLVAAGNMVAGSPPYLRVWEVRTGKELGPFQGSEGAYRVAFSPDGRRILAGGRDQVLWCWGVGSGKAVCQLEGHRETITGVAFSPDGRLAASSGQDGMVIVWRLPKADSRVAARPAADPIPPPGNGGDGGAAKEARPVKGWVSLMDTAEQVQSYWRHGSYHGFFLYDAVTRTMKIENWFGLGKLVHPAPWREFRFEVDVPDRHQTKFEVKVLGTQLDIGPALFAGKFPIEVTVKYDPATEEVQALVGGLVVQKERAKRGRRGESFECELFTFQGPRQREYRNLVSIRKARLLVMGHEGREEKRQVLPAASTRWLPLCETQEQVFQHWKDGSYQKGDGDGGSTRVETSRYDPKARTLTLAGHLGMGEFRHKGRWTEFEFKVESDAAWDGQFDLVVNMVGLPIGQALLGAKGGRLVTVRLDEAGHLLTVVIDGKEACRATVTAASWRNHSYDGVELGEGFTCGFRRGRGMRGRGGMQVRLREARLLVTEP